MVFWAAAFLTIHAFGGGAVVDAKKISLEDLPLKTYDTQSQVPVQMIKLPGDDGALIQDINGNRYDLSALEPYVELFAAKHFVPSNDKKTITDSRTGEVTTIPIYKATYGDGSIVLVEKDGDAIQYIELRRPQGEPDMFLVPDLNQQSGNADTNEEFLVYTEDDIDYDFLQSKFRYGEVSTPEVDDDDDDEGDDANRMLRSSERAAEDTMNFDDYREGREFFTSLSLRACSSYKVVNLAVVFDA